MQGVHNKRREGLVSNQNHQRIYSIHKGQKMRLSSLLASIRADQFVDQLEIHDLKRSLTAQSQDPQGLTLEDQESLRDFFEDPKLSFSNAAKKEVNQLFQSSPLKTQFSGIDSSRFFTSSKGWKSKGALASKIEDAASGAFQGLVILLLKQRCGYYHEVSWKKLLSSFTVSLPECTKGAEDLVSVLNSTRRTAENGAVGGAVFPDALEQLARSQEIKDYLRAILSQAHQVIRNVRKLNLWEATFEKTGRDSSKALEWIALLFQDSSKTQASISYLRTVLGEPYEETIDLLEEVNAVLKRNPQAVEYYPPFVQQQVHSKAYYHFYVIGYLALRLQKESAISREMATFLPFMFNTLYESLTNKLAPGVSFVPMRTDQIEWKKVEEMITHQFLFPTDPAPFEGEKYSHALEDIYLGYAGSYFALYGEERSRKELKNFGDFSNDFAKDPYLLMRSLLPRKVWDSSLYLDLLMRELGTRSEARSSQQK